MLKEDVRSHEEEPNFPGHTILDQSDQPAYCQVEHS